jgi:PAS domain S-box-containing protein
MRHDAEIASHIFEHARDIILVIDAASGALLDANEAAEHAYGYSREELLARSVFDLRIETPSSVQTQMTVAQQQGILFETVHRRRDGSTFPVEVSSRGATMLGRPCLFSIVRDVTERRRMEVEREHTLVDLQRALALRDEFLVIASHELLTPVTNVSLQLQQLARQIERGVEPGSVRHLGDSALREAHRLAGLIDALLVAQIAKGSLALQRTDVDLAQVLPEVAERLRARADQAGSLIIVAIDAPFRGRWDRTRVDQVLTNLLVNAVKYGRGRPIRASARADGDRAIIEVIDEGLGISPEAVSRIFDKFERALPSHYGGLGLGLYIARQLVEAHEGSIELESTVGVGTTFRVSLPTARC